MYLSKEAIEHIPNIKRLNIINSVSGIKPGNLIGTTDGFNQTNLAIISSVVHLGSNPAFMGFVLRPDEQIRRHTYENICGNGQFTINHIHSSFIDKAHWTSAKFAKEDSEFIRCGLTEEYLEDFKAPFVKESMLKIGLILEESIPIKATNTLLVVGRIEHLIIPDSAMTEEGYINLDHTDSVGISGLNSYYALPKLRSFPYARIENLPSFGRK
jgi:flavin reductase (DIM6/NTAB) family NADH-FMN oxidoreductase RutF